MRALVVLLCLVCAGVSVSCCPEGCACRLEQGLYAANCSSLPRTGGKVEALTVTGPQDEPLELLDGQFMLARHLKYLSLRNTSIFYIHKKAFYGAKNIMEIDLSFNYLEELEPTVFQQLTHLTTLILRGNPIQFASEVPFLISNSLQQLDIGQCQIRSLPRGIFYGLKRLKYLSMDGNFLKSLGYNSLPKGLKYIDLSNNHIVNVPTEVLSTLTSLRRVGLGGNPINCSCSLLNLQDWLSGRGVVFEDNVVCDLPTEYYGVSWSKVDENRVCLEEARREEISHSIVYTPLFKNKLYKGNYFDNENSYLGESIQSDQPQADVHPDSQAEVLFQNDDTFAMGQMMRNEEETKAVDENKNTSVDSNTEAELKENDEESATISKTDIEEEEFGTGNTEDESHNVEDNKKSEDVIVESEKILSVKDDESAAPKSADEPVEESSLQEVGEASDSHNILETHVENQEKTLDPPQQKSENILEIPTDSKQESFEDDKIPLTNHKLKEEYTESKEENNNGLADPINLNENTPLEYKQLNELNENDPNSETDVIKQEGFYHVNSEKYSLNSSASTEEPTILPNSDDTTEDEVNTTEEPVIDVKADHHSGEDIQNLTSSTEINNDLTGFETTPAAEITTRTPSVPLIIPQINNDTMSGVETTSNAAEITTPSDPTTPHSSLPEEDITNEPTMATTDDDQSMIDPELKSGNNSRASPAMKGPEEKVKQMAGAEVVMFCVAVLIICLVLYSIFKCRTSNKRQNTRIVKEIESNRDTEMQDMASLLPKPEDDQKKDLKYPDKAESSETVKLINEQNENKAPNITPVANSNIDSKNSLNNNSPASQNGKTPLIKPEGPAVTINPLGPIQRTKARVGIIPDSIPRTPILIQKSYTNGTKHV